MTRAPGATLHFGTGEPVTLVLVRHGVTTMTDSGAYSGSSTPGPPLTETGRAQVARAARLVARVGDDVWTDVEPPSSVLASPMVRTQGTGQVLADALGLALGTDARLAECDFGDWEGRTAEEVEDAWPGLLRRWHQEGTVAAPGGESMADVGRRVGGLLRELAATHAGRTVVLATHAVVLRSVVGSSVGLDPGRWYTLRVPPASVSAVRLWQDGHAELTALGIMDALAGPAALRP